MKKVFVFFAASILMLMNACNESTVNYDNNVVQSEKSYIPLQVGNEWYYKRYFLSDSLIVYSKVINSVKIANEKYYTIKFSNLFLCNYSYSQIGIDSTILLRTPDGITYYQYINGADRLYRIFKDTTISESEFNDLMVTNLNSQYVTHTQIGDLILSLVEVGGGSEPALYDYAKGLGLVKLGWFKGYCELIYAKIDGKIYGEPIK